jgi:hypothetical protein
MKIGFISELYEMRENKQVICEKLKTPSKNVPKIMLKYRTEN